MKSKLVIIIMILSSLIFSNAAYGAEEGQLPSQLQADILKNVKTLDQLAKYLSEKGLIKTFDDFRKIMEQNKALIRNYKPDMVDYGFTFRKYAEIYKAIDDYGIEFVASEHGKKEMQRWGIPVTINNTSDNPIQVSKEIFMLVPRHIPEGQELYVLGIEAEAMADPHTLNYLDEIIIEPRKERNLRIYFYVPTTTSEEYVNLRVYDGKDHVDVNLTK